MTFTCNRKSFFSFCLILAFCICILLASMCALAFKQYFSTLFSPFRCHFLEIFIRFAFFLAHYFSFNLRFSFSFCSVLPQPVFGFIISFTFLSTFLVCCIFPQVFSLLLFFTVRFCLKLCFHPILLAILACCSSSSMWLFDYYVFL